MKIVVAIDGNESAQAALEYLLKNEHPAATMLYLVHVMVPGFADAHVDGIPDVVAKERQEESQLLTQMAADLKSRLGITANTSIATGETAEVIASVCKTVDADEVIVPSHARHGFSRVWFGSVANEIVESAPCTAIVLKMHETAQH